MGDSRQPSTGRTIRTVHSQPLARWPLLAAKDDDLQFSAKASTSNKHENHEHVKTEERIPAPSFGAGVDLEYCWYYLYSLARSPPVLDTTLCFPRRLKVAISLEASTYPGSTFTSPSREENTRWKRNRDPTLTMVISESAKRVKQELKNCREMSTLLVKTMLIRISGLIETHRAT
ncbi:hypothetical protein E2P81_ATG07491 [Venturia nashicola]|uniref:Uncharacterized protein n=1 Tax=Venturia nashicola TaxID=86259 RepID=A0A4Z1PE90_9PEZI|nr:hypothetical protein E6O75_ATG07646 [Venturia nashicola]TLD32001.1 hypothetical protein E2P81_ATG07491 [Venturia nashicola]